MNRYQEQAKRSFQRIYNADYLTAPENPPVSSIIDALFLEPSSIVVEFGAGQGHFTLPIARRLEELRDRGLIFSFDFSAELINKLDEAAAELGVDVRIRSWPLKWIKEPDKLPISDGKVDRVLAVNFVQYVDDPLPICREFYRILKPGGFALIADWSESLHQVEASAGMCRPLPENVLTNLSKVGLGAHSQLALDGYSWVICAKKPMSL